MTPSTFSLQSKSIQPSQLEHLCINLCAETMQHFFNTHIFKSSIESCREEGIQCELEPDYVDNVPCIDLISSLVLLDILWFYDMRIRLLFSSTVISYYYCLDLKIANRPVEYVGRGVQRSRNSWVLCSKGPTPAQAQQQVIRVEISGIWSESLWHSTFRWTSRLWCQRLPGYGFFNILFRFIFFFFFFLFIWRDRFLVSYIKFTWTL